MKCPNCGYHLPADARFCPECGTKVDLRPIDSQPQSADSQLNEANRPGSPLNDPYAPSQPDPSFAKQPRPNDPYAAPSDNRNQPSYDEPVYSTQPVFSSAGPARPAGYEPETSNEQNSYGPAVETPYIPGENFGPSSGVQQNKNGCAIAAVITAVVLTLLVAIATVSCSVLSLTRNASHDTSWSNPFNFIHTDHPVTFMIMISSEYDEDSSRIPLRITGTDWEGNDVDKTIYLAHSGVDTELPEGSYKAEVLGSPIASDGTIYAIPNRTVEFEISEDLGPNEEYTLGNRQVFAFAALAPEEMTDELVNDALRWARKDEESGADVGKLEDAIKQRRATAATPKDEEPQPEASAEPTQGEQPEGEPAPEASEAEPPAEPGQTEEPGGPQE